MKLIQLRRTDRVRVVYYEVVDLVVVSIAT